MAAIADNSPFTTTVLFNLKDLGIDNKFINRYYTTMESERYICVREINSVVVIDMTKPTQPIRLPITADSAIMNPDNPILAFKVEDKIDGTTSQELRIYDLNTETTLKSYGMAKKVECWKWISPKLLGLVTRKAVYHWSLEGSAIPVKMWDMPDDLATHKDAEIANYVDDISNKWLAVRGYRKKDNDHYYNFFVRRYQSGDQWFRLDAHAAAFTTFNVEGNDAPSTLLCSAIGEIRYDHTYCIQLRVSDGLGSQQGQPNFGKKQLIFGTYAAEFVKAVQISQKYGLIYVITHHGLVSIHDLETAEAICSCNIVDYKRDEDQIICTTEGPSSESFYAINQKGQVLLTSFNDDSTMLFSLVSDKLVSRGKAHELRKLCLQLLEEKEEIVKNLEKSRLAEISKKDELEEQLAGVRKELHSFQETNQEMSNEIETLKKHRGELQNESVKIKRDLEETLSNITETKKQLPNMSTEIHNYQTLEKQMLNEIEQLKTQKAEQQIENNNTIKKLEKSLQEKKSKGGEIEEQLARMRTEMLNEIEELKKENAKLQDERGKIVPHKDHSLQVEKKVWTEMEQLTGNMIELKNYQKSLEELLNRIELLTKQNTELTMQNAERTKEKDQIIATMAGSLQVEQNAKKEIEEQLRAKMAEIDDYRKSQEEMMNKIEDFRLLKETNNLEAIFTEYSRAELEAVTNDFSDSLKIGEGGYGPVYKAFLGLKPVAIKILKYEDSHGKKQFNQEVEILSRVRHPNLVMLLGACREVQALVYELMPNGSLYDILRNKKTPSALTSKRRIRIASDICSALLVLHSTKPHGILHGDLKSSNILLDSNYMGKLSDFGICRHLEITDSRNTAHHYTNTLKGTRPYMDPECFHIGELTAQYDVFSFGIVLLELVTGRDPMGLRNEVEEAFKKGETEIFVDASAGEWPLEEAKKMMQLGLRCSHHSRKNRPDLVKEVSVEIESMLRASLHF